MGSRGMGDNDNLQPNRVFVGGISWKADETALANFFSSFGKVIECKIIMDKVTGKSKGYGFVTFQDVASAEQVKQSNNLYFLGKMMNVGDAVRKSEGSSKSQQPHSHQQSHLQQPQSPQMNQGYSQQAYMSGQQGYYNPYIYNQGYQQGFSASPYLATSQGYVQQGQQQYYNPGPAYYSQPNYYPQFQQSEYQQAWQPMPNYPQQAQQQPPQQYRPVAAPASPPAATTLPSGAASPPTNPTSATNPGATAAAALDGNQQVPVGQHQLLQLHQQVGAQLQQQIQQLQQMAAQSPVFIPGQQQQQPQHLQQQQMQQFSQQQQPAQGFPLHSLQSHPGTGYPMHGQQITLQQLGIQGQPQSQENK